MLERLTLTFFSPWRWHRKDSSHMLLALPMRARIGRPTPALVLIALGLMLVPVQCSVGLHSIFVAATSPAAGSPVDESHQQHAANHHASHASDAPDGSTTRPIAPWPPLTLAEPVGSSASEQRPPSPVTSATIDHPYTVALGRVVSGVDTLSAHLPVLIVITLAPDALAIAPELPPPRMVA